MWETLKLWDRELLIFLNNLGAERYDSYWIVITQIESWIPLFILCLIIIFYYYTQRRDILVFLFVVATFGLTILCTEIARDLFARVRPNNVTDLSEAIRVLQNPATPSFFSGHASTSFAITTYIVLAIRKLNKWIYLLYLWPFLFAYSRIYVGVHYPSDILIGALFGIAMAYIVYGLSKKILQ